MPISWCRWPWSYRKWGSYL